MRTGLVMLLSATLAVFGLLLTCGCGKSDTSKTREKAGQTTEKGKDGRLDKAEKPLKPDVKKEAERVASPDDPNIHFESLTFNFGTVIKGTKVVHEFVFTNTGKSTLVIEKAKGL